MKAALVESFDRSPRCTDVDAPQPGAGETRVRVRAAAVSQLVRAQASGKHYASGGKLPFVPGVDGVGDIEGGKRVYFAFPTSPHGAMAEVSVVDSAFVAEIPDGLDDVSAAAMANPGMSAWAALTERITMRPGAVVLVNGATGASGRLAVSIAKHLGAKRVVATGRDSKMLATLSAIGADEVISLETDRTALVAALRRAFESGVDVVLDYLWGPPAERVLEASTSAGPRAIQFVQIGSMAGASATVPAASLRSTGLTMVGSGLGSVPRARLFAATVAMLRVAAGARFEVEAKAAPIADVEKVWNDGDGRVVITMPRA